MLTKKIIFSGVQFNKENNYTGNFNETDIYKFMEKYLIKVGMKLKKVNH